MQKDFLSAKTSADPTNCLCGALAFRLWLDAALANPNHGNLALKPVRRIPNIDWSVGEEKLDTRDEL
jgi:hypothetical protein